VDNQIAGWQKALQAAAALAAGPKWRRFMHTPRKYILAQLFRKLVYPSAQKTWSRNCTTFFGVPMTVLLPAGMDIFLLGCKTHDSELRLAKFMLNHLKEGQTVIDVGAHFGFFSLLAASLVGKKGRVTAFEPGQTTFEVLSKNTGALPHIRVENLAAGAQAGTLDFWEFPALFSEYNTTKRDAVPEHIEGTLRRIPMVSLDAYCAANLLSPDFIKMDVEGAEWDVLCGMSALLSEPKPPVIAMEYLGKDSHRMAVQFLNARGYQTFVITTNGHATPCPEPDQHLKTNDIDSENLVFLRILPN
jgi:FkbM family methyltransferase